MEEVLGSADYVVNNAQMVRIDNNALEKFAGQITIADLEQTEYADGDSDLTPEQTVAFTFVFQSACYSFWGDPKWKVSQNGQSIDGSRAMLAAFRSAIATGTPLLEAEYLRSMTIDDLATILKGNVQIPLFDERHAMLRRLGEVIADDYSGSFMSFVDKTGWEAATLVHKLVAEMPEIFDDKASYRSRPVYFYKRAQLIPAKLHDYWRAGKLPQEISGLEKLTAFADYKIPQLLREVGVLVYSDDLQQKIDNQIELKSSSAEEIEIRASTIWAIEKLRLILEDKFGPLTSAPVDTAVFLMSRDDSRVHKPYHHTRTVWY